MLGWIIFGVVLLAWFVYGIIFSINYIITKREIDNSLVEMAKTQRRLEQISKYGAISAISFLEDDQKDKG